MGAAVLTQGDGETEECSRGHLQGQGRRRKWVSYRRAFGWAGWLLPGVQGPDGIWRPKGALPGMRQQRAREDQRRGPAKKARSVCAKAGLGVWQRKLQVLGGTAQRSFSGVGKAGRGGEEEEDRAGRVQNELPIRSPSLLLWRQPLGMWPNAPPWVGTPSPSPSKVLDW